MSSIAQKRIELARRDRSQKLSLNGLHLKQIPTELAQLHGLRVLDLSGNDLTDIPDAVWDLEGLVDLDLGHNSLVSVDAGIRRLSHLRVLDLSENRLAALPDAFGPALRELCFYHNQLVTVPEAILCLVDLEMLDLSSNRIAMIPSLVGRWTALRELDLRNNNLERLPDGIGGLRSLHILYLANNRLSSVGELRTLEQLEELYLEGNPLTKIPIEITRLPALRILSAADEVTAKLPTAVSHLSGDETRRSAETALRNHILGGAAKGNQFAKAPTLSLGAALSLSGITNIGKLIDLYYKGSHRDTSISIKYPSGPPVSLKDLSRKTALRIAAQHEGGVKSQPATIGWQGAVSAAEMEKILGFSQEAAWRVPGAKIIKNATGETIFHNPSKGQRHSAQRRVGIDLYDVTDPKSRPKVVDRLLPDRSYELVLFIAAAPQATVVAPIPVPTEKLPPGENILSVHFVPLVRASNGDVLPSQHKSLTLPETADSKACTFRFNVPPMVDIYRARLIISYRNRVLQTLILSAPVGNAAGNFLLDVENIIDPFFEKLSERSPFDAAILVNDSPNGVRGLTTTNGDQAVFSELPGLDKVTKDLRQFLLEKSAARGPMREYKTKQMKELIYTLSSTGKELWDALTPTTKALLKGTTRRIQIVDARIGAYFPAEFIYRGDDAPLASADLCDNGAAALWCPVGVNSDGGMSHEKCMHKDDPTNFICPLRLWGLGLVIEHQAATGEPQGGYILRNVTNGINKVRTDVLDCVVVSVSNKVHKADPTAAGSLVSALSKVAKKVFLAENWTKLKEIVRDNSPTLIVLLPHAGLDTKIPGKPPTLELGGEVLARRFLKPEHIQGPKSDQPVVLLLGCDTAMAEVPFLNVIKRFNDCGAAMVMGTITQVEARRTVDFVKRFIGAVAVVNERSPTFGDLLLETRRHMLAAGDGYALSLLAYGDTDQRA